MKIFKEIAIALAITALLQGGIFAIARAADGLTTPFGGFVFSFVPPSPICPIAHQVLYNYANNTIMGVALTPASSPHLNYKFYAADVFVLGTVYSAPIPCLLPYPIYPIEQAGTS